MKIKHLVFCFLAMVVASTSLFRCGKSKKDSEAKTTLSGSVNSGKF